MKLRNQRQKKIWAGEVSTDDFLDVEKECSKCGKSKPRRMFCINYVMKDGRNSSCKECQNLLNGKRVRGSC